VPWPRLSLVVVLVVALSALLAGGGAAQTPPPTCFGQRATVVGTGGSDKMTGTSGPDVMVGQGGNDAIDGGGGDDLICGNNNNDTLRGGGGNDRIDGGSDADTVGGDAGNDTVDGGGGDDTDVLSGGPGNDAIIGKHSGDVVNDYVDYRSSAGGVQVDLQARTATGDGSDTLSGIDWVIGSQSGDTVTGSVADNVVDGEGGNDRIDGGPGGDMLTGGGGDDTLAGGSGAGNGALEHDYAVYTGAPNGVQVDLAAGRATGWGTDALSGIEGVFGSRFNDVLAGGPGDNLLWGQDGDDELRGQDGEDFAVFAKSVDADLARGTALGEGTDRLVGIVGLEGSAGNDKLTGDAKRNVLAGGPGGTDVLAGGAGPDVLLSGGASTLSGGAGADRLSGGKVNDTLDGGPGDDLLTAGAGDDSIDGGAGTEDIVDYLFASAVHVDLAQGTATGDGTDRLVNVESVSGSGHDDDITGDAKPNSLSGYDGNDRLSGGSGPDFLDGGVGSNQLFGGLGKDYCLQRGVGCESSGGPNIPGKAPLPPGVTPPRRVLASMEAPSTAPRRGDSREYGLALGAELAGPRRAGRVLRGETAAYKYAAEPICFAAKRPYSTEIAPPRTVNPVAGDGKPEEAWWQGTLYRADPKRKGRYKKVKTTPWARAQLAGGSAIPGVTLWKDQTGKQPFPNTVRVKANRGRYVWKGNLYWVRSGGQVFQPIEPHIIRARTITHSKQCVFR
jgi:Ca2+-binding RTX toxin-like protein